MPQELRALYTDEVNSLSVVAIDTQLDSTFRKSCNEFFSVVKPVSFIQSSSPLAPLAVFGLVDTVDTFGFGIGSYRIVQTFVLESTLGVRVEPLDYESFKVGMDYTADFQRVCRFFLKQLEKDNVTNLKGFGIDLIQYDQSEDLQQLRDELQRKYTALGAKLIVADV